MFKLLAILFLVLPVLTGICSAGLYEPTVILSDYEVVPSVLMPGDTGTITVTLTNTATSSTSTVTDSQTSTQKEINPTIKGVYLDGGKDINVIGGNSAFSGDLGPQQSVKITFAIEAPPKKGIYYAVLRVGVKESENLAYPIMLNVNMPLSALKKPMLIVSQSGSVALSAGENIEIPVSIRNSGRSTAEDIFIRISEESASLAPLGSSTFHISSLSAGESASINLSFISDRDIEAGVHEIPVILSYSIVDGTDAVQTDTIVLDVKGNGEISIASLKT
ncbi:MAG: CARDB domain-containing protein, partial [Methanomicrobium sp.]|nr:CARDB domain-containing protein [Methanomicrobium sp.]